MRFNSKLSIPINHSPIPKVYIYLNFIALAIRARRSAIVELVPFPNVGPSVVVGCEDDEESVDDPEESVVPVPLGLPLVTLPEGPPVVEDEPPSTLPVAELEPLVLEGESDADPLPEEEALGSEPEDEAVGLEEESMEPDEPVAEEDPVALGEALVEPEEPVVEVADPVVGPVMDTDPVADADPVPDAEDVAVPVADPVAEVLDVLELVVSMGALCKSRILHPLIAPGLPPRTFPAPQL